MTLKSAKNTLRARGMTINSREGEYRVNFSGGSEPMAYYTNDIEDAVNTGIAMADQREARREADRKLAQHFVTPIGAKPAMSHSEEFALRTDLRAIEQSLFQLRYKALDYTIGNPQEVLAKIEAVRAQLDSLTSNVRDQIDPARVEIRKSIHAKALASNAQS